METSVEGDNERRREGVEGLGPVQRDEGDPGAGVGEEEVGVFFIWGFLGGGCGIGGDETALGEGKTRKGGGGEPGGEGTESAEEGSHCVLCGGN